jgi:hypothetical protein
MDIGQCQPIGEGRNDEKNYNCGQFMWFHWELFGGIDHFTSRTFHSKRICAKHLKNEFYLFLVESTQK